VYGGKSLSLEAFGISLLLFILTANGFLPMAMVLQ
jgi:hypothetical protein